MSCKASFGAWHGAEKKSVGARKSLSVVVPIGQVSRVYFRQYAVRPVPTPMPCYASDHLLSVILGNQSLVDFGENSACYLSQARASPHLKGVASRATLSRA